MAATAIRGKAQIKAATVVRSNANIDVVGDALVTKIIQGSGISLVSTGADAGTGDVTVSATGAAAASSIARTFLLMGA